MRVLVLGGSGMLGHTLWRFLGRRFETWATVRDPGTIRQLPVLDASRAICPVDVLQPESITKAFSAAAPEVVINCVGAIKQLPQGNDPVTAIEINALLPHKLARLCSSAGARFVHVSTDCVFSGSKGGYTEDDVPDPEDLYGRSKLLGEVSYGDAVTLRTSMIGHELQSKVGLLEWFLGEKAPVRGFKRAMYSGLTALELSRVIAEQVIPRPELKGLYHVSSSPISKYELLLLVRAAYARTTEVVPDDSVVCDRTLNSSRFSKITGYQAPPWARMIEEMAMDFSHYGR